MISDFEHSSDNILISTPGLELFVITFTPISLAKFIIGLSFYTLSVVSKGSLTVKVEKRKEWVLSGISNLCGL